MVLPVLCKQFCRLKNCFGTFASRLLICGYSVTHEQCDRAYSKAVSVKEVMCCSMGEAWVYTLRRSAAARGLLIVALRVRRTEGEGKLVGPSYDRAEGLVASRLIRLSNNRHAQSDREAGSSVARIPTPELNVQEFLDVEQVAQRVAPFEVCITH